MATLSISKFDVIIYMRNGLLIYCKC